MDQPLGLLGPPVLIHPFPKQGLRERNFSWGETSYLLPYFEAIVNSDSMPRSTRSFCHSRFQENWLDHGQGLLGSPEP